MRRRGAAKVNALLRCALRFHRDERGDALEYVLVAAVFVLPLMALFDKLKDILGDYFAMISFYVGWPFL